tara:strand:+ start:313 stop:594 length:282 start_codon:yes stop_codon:yes gene_type:complete
MKIAQAITICVVIAFTIYRKSAEIADAKLQAKLLVEKTNNIAIQEILSTLDLRSEMLDQLNKSNSFKFVHTTLEALPQDPAILKALENLQGLM